MGKWLEIKYYILDKLDGAQDILRVLVALLSERSTWQGIGFFAGLLISKDLASLDWGAAAAVGGAASAVFKLWPDKKDV